MPEQYIQINVDKTIKALSNLERKQWPFALAKTLTNVAQLAKERVHVRTQRVFKLRNKKFILKGITIRPAKKTDVRMGKGEAEVYTKPSISRFMTHHEKGALRRPIRSKVIASPAKDLKGKQFRTAKGRVKKTWSPKTLMKQAGSYAWMYKYERSVGLPQTQRHNKRLKPFIISTKTGAKAIVRRKTRKSRKLEYLWILKRVVRIDPDWKFEKTVRHVVDRVFEGILKRNLAKAVRTAK